MIFKAIDHQGISPSDLMIVNLQMATFSVSCMSRNVFFQFEPYFLIAKDIQSVTNALT